ncbi:uncharacterized protein LOC6553743 [Drosophila erecta]|uniref:GG17102 n=1 Tax=Drosophila erecta TaxID=7220 RepID=B3P474_DROER|nr:uncharacterized protein LOC6553743 [Drosophila erecta]EDV49319.1 uncharacterized protein Dere_GG17102 [Drosophila erecta]
MEFPIPEAQYWDVSKKSQKDRQMIRKFVPEAVDLATISRAEIYRIDTFYLECQKYRDHYRDPYGKVHCPAFFHLHKGKCGIKLDQSVIKMTQAIAGNVDRQPIVFPLIPNKSMFLGGSIPMGSQTAQVGVTSYLR